MALKGTSSARRNGVAFAMGGIPIHGRTAPKGFRERPKNRKGKMEPMEQAYFISDDEGRIYFTGSDAGERLLDFLRHNDPVECGARMLKSTTCRKLEELGDDERLEESEIN